MKRLIKLFGLCAGIVICLFSLGFYYRVFILKNCLIQGFQYYGLVLEFAQIDEDDHAQRGKLLTVKKVQVKKDHEIVMQADEVSFSYDFFRSGQLNLVIDASNVHSYGVKVGDVQMLYHYSFFGSFSSVFATLDKINVSAFGNSDRDPIFSAELHLIKEQNSYKIEYCNIHDDNKGLLNGQLSLINGNNLQVRTIIQNLSIKNYKRLLSCVLQAQSVDNSIVQQIKSGKIVEGTVNLNLDDPSKFSLEQILSGLQASLKLADVGFIYIDDLPEVRSADFDVQLADGTIYFSSDNAYIADSKLTDVRGEFNVQQLAKAALILKAKATGPVGDIIKFIPQDSLRTLQDKDINLLQTVGIAQTELQLTLPVFGSLAYQASSKIQGVDLKIFKDSVALSNFSLTATSNNHETIVKGEGDIEGFKSSLTYRHNEDTDQDNLSIAIQLTPGKLGTAKITAGKANLHIDYESRTDLLKIHSDLTNTAFDVDIANIVKPQGRPSTLLVTKKSSDPHFKIDLSILEMLNLSSKFTLSSAGNTIEFTKFQHYKDDLALKVFYDNKKIVIRLSGKTLDLSRYELNRLFSSDSSDKRSIIVEAGIDRIIMHNDIDFTDFNLSLECRDGRCYQGKLASNIGTRKVTAFINPANKDEQWIIHSSNAGALLMATDVYKNIRAGSLSAIITRQSTSKIVGEFKIEKFVTVEAPILTRIVSFISLSGLQQLVFFADDKKLAFRIMVGEFSYDKSQINIDNLIAEGPHFDFTMDGKIDTLSRKIGVQGTVMPSFYGISNIAKRAPIIRKILSGIQKIFFYNFTQQY